MKKVVVNLVSAAALTLGMAAATNGMAATSQNFSNHTSSNGAGIFVSGNLGYSNTDFNKSDFNLGGVGNGLPVTLTKKHFAWNANLGYQFNKYFAIEGGYTSVPGATATYTAAANSYAGTDTISTMNGLGLDVKGILPVSKKFDVFAKAGAMRLSGKVTEVATIVPATRVTNFDAWTPMFGIGTDYNISKNIAVNVQDIYLLQANYNGYNNAYNTTTHLQHIPATNMVLAGVSYKFNM